MIIKISDDVAKKFNDRFKLLANDLNDEQELKEFILTGFESLAKYIEGEEISLEKAQAAVVLLCGFEFAFTELRTSMTAEYPELINIIWMLQEGNEGV